MPQPGRPFRVLVIGGGFAGLSAARSLTSQAGDAMQVTVLEAGQTVGGRCRTGKLPSGTPVELGATWFHGVRDNPVYDMAVWQGVVKDVRMDPEVQKHEIDWQLHFARPLEPQLLTGDLNAVAMEAVGRYTEAAEECTQGAQVGDGSVGDVLRRTFDRAVTAEGLSGPALSTFAEAWHFREQLQRTFDGFFSTDDVSLAFAREYETLDGPNMPVPGGYQHLADILSQGLDVRCDHRVSKIEYGPHGARVTCANGIVMEADAVLVTVSVGVLQHQHQAIFDPPLPDWKVKAMEGVRIGVADKIFVEFEIDPAHAMDASLWLTSHTTSSQAAVLGLPGSSRPSTTGETLLPNSSGSLPSSERQCLLPQHQQQPTSSPPHVPPSPGSPIHHGSVAGASPSPPPHLPPGVARALPPPATGGQPEPWNMGRKAAYHLASPKQHAGMSEDSCASIAAALPSFHFQQQQQHHHHQPGAALLATVQAQTLQAQLLSAAAGGGSGNWAPHLQHGINPHIPHNHSGMGMLQQHLHSMQHPTTSGSSTCSLLPPKPRRRKHKRAIHSYAFLWPVADPLSLGVRGHPKLTGIWSPLATCALPRALAPLNIPRWCMGLHSIRYCPGPEWITPALLQQHDGTGSYVLPDSSATSIFTQTLGLANLSSGGGAGAGLSTSRKRSAVHATVDGPEGASPAGAGAPGVHPETGGASHISGVLWITGDAALEMERATDEEVVAGVVALYRAFPQVPLPPGAKMPPRVVRTKWGTDPYFHGSYSYMRLRPEDKELTGEAVDALGEPLCNDEGTPIVLFAGEATHRQYLGTVHGAFLTGLREAERLMLVLQQREAAAVDGFSGVAADADCPVGSTPGSMGAGGHGMHMQYHPMMGGSGQQQHHMQEQHGQPLCFPSRNSDTHSALAESLANWDPTRNTGEFSVI